MTTKAELEEKLKRLEAESARKVLPDSLRLFSFIYSANGAIMASTPPTGSEELMALKGALEQIASLIDDKLLQAVAQEARQQKAA